jgi:NAD(P)-dependent dehydrogenase (short-subunit alcohol dehydrogenase family)
VDIESLFSVKDKVALVTGGSRGIGLMMTEGLVSAGAKVYISSRKAEVCEAEAERLSQFGQCIALPADLGSEAGAKALADALMELESKLPILINNAGATWGAPFDEFPDKAWDRVLNLNLRAPFHLAKFLHPALKKAGTHEDPARIINVGSVAGFQSNSIAAYSYGPSKAAIHHLTRILASELAQDHITVNCIAPGAFPSKMTEFALGNDSMRKMMESQIPLKRLGEPEDVAGLTLYLCSRAGAYMTGNVIPLDGGSLIKAM